MQEKKSSTAKWVLLLAALLMVILHQDFWNWDKVDPRLFGFLPVGLAYHALYAIACAALMWFFVQFAWPTELEQAGPADAAARAVRLAGAGSLP